VLAGAGDELQGIKRGIMELADAILVTKADGENIGSMLKFLKIIMKMPTHLFPKKESNWVTRVEPHVRELRIKEL
jgi:LAO/AO transport system kinase